MRRLPWLMVLVACGAPPPVATTRAPSSLETPHAARLSDDEGREATPRELRGALRQHRALTPPPPLVDGRVEVPRDWKQLPQSAVLWRSEMGTLFPHSLIAFEGALVGARYGEFVGLEADSGRELWVRRQVEGAPHAYAVRGCDGAAVLVEPTGITGVDARTGEERWAHPLEPRARSTYLFAGSPTLHGCTLTLQLVRGARRIAEREPTTLLAIDTRTGAQRELHGCDGADCRTSALSTERGALLTDSDGARWVDLEDGSVTALPAGAQALVQTPEGPLVLTRASEAQWGGVRLDGTAVWEREEALRPIGRFEDSMLAVGDAALVRIDLRTGQDVWSLGLSDELAYLVRRRDAVAIAGSRLALGSRTTPELLLLVDLATGRLDALRLAPQDPVGVAMAGERLYLAAHDETLAIRLDREAAPIRDRLTLEEDLRRSIAQLAGPPGRPMVATRSGHIPHYHYPAGSDAAREWLERLGPDALPALRVLALEGSLEDAANMVPTLTEAPVELCEAILNRTIADRPNLARAHLRVQAIASFGALVLSEEFATRLSENAIAWLEYAHREGGLEPSTLDRCDGSERCRLIAGTYEAVVATRDLLARSSTRAEPVRSLRAAIRGAPSAPASCTPTGDDAVRLAVLEHLFEASLVAPPAVLAPGIGCAPLRSRAGPIPVSAEASTDARPYWEIGPAEVPSRRPIRWGVPAWDDAPMRRVSYQWYSGPLSAEGGEYYLIELDGLWRVVHGGMRWIS